MSKSGRNFLATEPERAADAEIDLSFARHVMRDVAMRLQWAIATMLDVTPPNFGTLADVTIQIGECAKDLRSASETN